FGFVFGEDWREYFTAIPGGLEQTIADTDVLFEVENPAMGEWLAVPFDLDNIDQPTLILYGDESPLFGAEVQRAYKAAMPDTELESIANTDHALITQNPSAVAEAIAGFLARHSM